MACTKVIGIFLCVSKNLVQFSDKDCESFHCQVLFLTSHKRNNLMNLTSIVRQQPQLCLWESCSREVNGNHGNYFQLRGLQRRRNTRVRPSKHSRHSQDGCNLCWLKASHNSSSQPWASMTGTNIPKSLPLWWGNVHPIRRDAINGIWSYGSFFILRVHRDTLRSWNSHFAALINSSPCRIKSHIMISCFSISNITYRWLGKFLFEKKSPTLHISKE